MHASLRCWLIVWLLALAAPLPGAGFSSHPPVRPLPEASSRAMGTGPGFFADARRGDDRNDGSKEKPWKTVGFALGRLKPGDTLYLRGGVYHEHLAPNVSGEVGRPITLRGYPGELAVVDGGEREFLEQPAESWEPVPSGAPGEYVSRKTFPNAVKPGSVNQFVTAEDEPFTGVEDDRPLALGQFADSMVTLHGYRFLRDLRAPQEGIWRITPGGKTKQDQETGVYLGPGLWYDRKDARVHIRLAPTRFDWMSEAQNYRGESDPRRIPLVIAVGYGHDVLRLSGVRHLRVQDLVLRGAASSALVHLDAAEGIEFDGLTLYGGAPSLLGRATKGLRVVNCAFRSLGSAPWESRSSMKYRGTPSYVVIAQDSQPRNEDWEMAQCEFTDGHDFAHFRQIRNLRFHHNFVENFNDDGMEFGPRTRDQLAWVWGNLITQTEIVLSQHEIDRVAPDPLKGDPGSGIFVFRNLIDLRRPTYCSPWVAEEALPTRKGKTVDIWRQSGLCGDHGSPIWAQYYFYQNTVLMAGRSFRDHYAFGLGEEGMLGKSHIAAKTLDGSSPRRVFNNILIQVDGLPGLVLPPKPEEVDLQVDGNLFWSVLNGPSEKGDFFAKVRGSAAFEASKKQYPPGWGANDRFGDPRFARFPAVKNAAEDFSLQRDSPAIGAGVPIPADWPDEMRPKGDARPDVGALPAGVAPWRVGVNGRLSLFPPAP